MNSDRRYNGNVNFDLFPDLAGFYIEIESKRILNKSIETIGKGIELIVNIRQERKSQRYLEHVMNLRI